MASDSASPPLSENSPKTSPQSPEQDRSDVTPPRDLPSLVRLATDRTLRFLSNASNETLGACLVGLSATTYVLLGRLGLVIIGAVGGVVLHATWENGTGNGRDTGSQVAELRRRKEVGVDVLQRVMEWRDATREKERAGRASEDEDGFSTTSDSYNSFKPETATALNALADAVVRDYVKWWYTPILPLETGFPNSCRRVWNNFMLSMSTHLSRKRSADAFLDFATNSSSIVIVFLNEISNALSASPNADPSDAIRIYLRLKPNSNLANIIDPKHQEKKLLMVADDILENFLDVNAYRCAPARVFLREVLARLVLEQTIEMCSEAPWINDWIVYLLEDGEPELLSAIDEGLGKDTSSPDASVPRANNEISSAKRDKTSGNDSKSKSEHKRRVSRAEEAMDEAMREAQRLTKLILEEEAKRSKSSQQQNPVNDVQASDNVSESTGPPTQGIQTPTSSQDDVTADEEQAVSLPISDNIAERDETVPDAPALTSSSTFTNFDQIQPSKVPTALLEPELQLPKQPATFTLVNAKIIIFDEGPAAEKKVLKSKPMDDFLIQVEPSSSIFPGWMIPRKYADFETLHEVIRRIAAISGVDFGALHSTMPVWKNATAGQLRTELEMYLIDALKFEPLAESEGMKRFLDKDRGLTRSPNKSGFWPNPAAFENMGKGMLNVLTKAPNQVAGGVVGGGKAVIGGVTNVFTGGTSSGSNANGLSQRPESERQISYPTSGSRRSKSPANFPTTTPVATTGEKKPYPTSGTRANATYSAISIDTSARTSQESIPRPLPSPSSATNLASPFERRQSVASSSNGTEQLAHKHASRSSVYGDNVIVQRGLSVNSAQPSRSTTPELTNLPPPPEDMPDDYTSPPRTSTSHGHSNARPPSAAPAVTAQTQTSVDGTSFFDVPTTSSPSSPARSPMEHIHSPEPLRRPSTTGLKTSSESTRRSPLRRTESVKKERPRIPMSEQEAQVTVELFFAVVNEMYTLSSAWNIRRTLLGAAKTFLLRPGNPQLESIRLLLQEAVIDSNTSDAGIAAHINKLRENTMPTEEERAKWPAPPTSEEQEKLRRRARKLLIERGMPQALTSVMGMAASGEALGKVFDCLQIKELSRGLMFGVFLQAMRAITQ